MGWLIPAHQGSAEWWAHTVARRKGPGEWKDAGWKLHLHRHSYCPSSPVRAGDRATKGMTSLIASMRPWTGCLWGPSSELRWCPHLCRSFSNPTLGQVATWLHSKDSEYKQFPSRTELRYLAEIQMNRWELHLFLFRATRYRNTISNTVFYVVHLYFYQSNLANPTWLAKRENAVSFMSWCSHQGDYRMNIIFSQCLILNYLPLSFLDFSPPFFLHLLFSNTHF